MNTIFSLFDFAEQEIGYVFGRFGIEVLLSVVLCWLVAFIILAFTKRRPHKIGFSNWVKVCFMYGIDAAIVLLGVIVILTIRANGIDYFAADALSWSWFCGYLLMTPEMLIMIALVSVYWVLNKQVYKSIN